MDLTTLTNEELDSLRVQILTEQERRAKINAIPKQITDLREEFLEAGGDLAALED